MVELIFRPILITDAADTGRLNRRLVLSKLYSLLSHLNNY